MFKKNEFKAALARAEKTTADVAKTLNIDTSTLSRKMARQVIFSATKLNRFESC